MFLNCHIHFKFLVIITCNRAFGKICPTSPNSIFSKSDVQFITSIASPTGWNSQIYRFKTYLPANQSQACVWVFLMHSYPISKTFLHFWSTKIYHKVVYKQLDFKFLFKQINKSNCTRLVSWWKMGSMSDLVFPAH